MQGNALATNSDGSIVLGSCYFNTTGSSRAFLWRQDLGMVDLNDYALAHGVNLGNWTLGSATGISADNQVIVGTGWNGPNIEGFMIRLGGDPPCYPNCDGSTTAPVLDVLDFNCFMNRFFAGDTYANCDGSTSPPVLNVLDFNCFLNRFIAGCP